MMLSKKYLWILIAVFIFVIDRVTKSLVLNHLTLAEPVNILSMLNLLFTFNTGAAFGFLNKASGWQEWLFITIAVGVSIFLIIWQLRIPVKYLWLKIAAALILGGTLGNLYDRIVFHKVIDFLDFYFKKWHYPVFNIADAAICVGATMLIIDILLQEKRKNQNSFCN
jgi:signal peptidase II